MRVTNHGVQVHLFERHLTSQFHAHHYHTSDPEEQNVVSSFEEGRWVKLGQIRCLVGPAKDGKRKQTGREPSVEHVFVLFECEFSTRELLLGRNARFIGVTTDDPSIHLLRATAWHPTIVVTFAVETNVEGWNTMTPPKLTGDAPVTNVLQPSEPRRFHESRENFKSLVASGIARLLCHVLAIDPPLRLEHRFDDILTTATKTQTHRVVRLAPVKTKLVERLRDGDAALKALHALELLAALLVHQSFLGEYVDKLKIVTLTGVEIVRIVGWGDLHATCTEFHVDKFGVANDGNTTTVERVKNEFSV
mmetsp:Transcript_5065/g.19540  ORF Transcript_5065/g.19540 Transcript_5065/m.19540 type:complete len:306 (-) Transcript_5065:1289-2206(-)